MLVRRSWRILSSLSLLLLFHTLWVLQRVSLASDTTTSALSTSQVRPLKKTAALCAIVKDEERYIDEWIDYNLAIGFQTIYLYDNSDNFAMQQRNNSTETTLSSQERVQVVHFPGVKQQMRAYQHCVDHHVRADRHEWVAFLDVDEFLILKQHATVVDMLKEHCMRGALGIHWMMYGTSNQTQYEALPVTKRFMYRDSALNEYVKSIVRVHDLAKGKFIHNPHFVMLRNSNGNNATRMMVDTNGTEFPTDRPTKKDNGPSDVAVLNHYKFKSEGEFYVKGCVRGRADSKFKSSCDVATIAGEVYDDSAWEALKRLVPKYRAFDEAGGTLNTTRTTRT